MQDMQKKVYAFQKGLYLDDTLMEKLTMYIKINCSKLRTYKSALDDWGIQRAVPNIKERMLRTGAFIADVGGKPVAFYNSELEEEDKLFHLAKLCGHIFLGHPLDKDHFLSKARSRAALQKRFAHTAVWDDDEYEYEDEAYSGNNLKKQAIAEINAQEDAEASRFAALLLWQGDIWAKKARWIRITGVLVLIIVIGIFGMLHPRSEIEKVPPESEETVAITRTGEKYHQENCEYVIDKSDIRIIARMDAEEEGYAPCSACFETQEEIE